MSESTSSSRGMALAHLGGGLGIAACFIGLGVFLGACAGFNAILMLSIIPLTLGSAGLLLSVIGPIAQKSNHVEDSAVFAAMFINVMGVLGALLLMSAWLGWRVLPGTL